MRIIKEICESMRRSMGDAEHYAKLAIQHKDDDRALADVYYDIAQSHLDAIDRLHKCAVDYINEYRSSGGQTPTAMQVVWDWEHDKMIEDMAHVKELLHLYK